MSIPPTSLLPKFTIPPADKFKTNPIYSQKLQKIENTAQRALNVLDASTETQRIAKLKGQSRMLDTAVLVGVILLLGSMIILVKKI